MLLFENGEPFVTGSSTYTYLPATAAETTPRIFVRVSFEGIDTTAFLDTGSPYVILNPNIAEELELDIRSGVPHQNYLFRTGRLDGYLHRLNLQFLAERGGNLDVDATVFIPELKPYQQWGDFPSIIGLNTCLERMRFAIDPSRDKFYFGELT